MTTPAFDHLITTDTVSVGHRLSELRQVATDLRNERTLRAPEARHGPNRLRLAVGSALLQVGAALVASPNRTTIQAR